MTGQAGIPNWPIKFFAVIAVVAAMIGIYLASTAHTGWAGAKSLGFPRPVIAGTQSAADTRQCFYTFPACTSTDPNVKFTLVSVGDTTACKFETTVGWGDGSSSEAPYSGGQDKAPLVPFKHTYGDVGKTYTITISSKTTVGSCHMFSDTNYFTLAASCSVSAGAASPCSSCPSSPAVSAGDAGVQASYFWARAYTPGTTADFASGKFEVAQPKLVAGDCHSLAELAVSSAPSPDTGFDTSGDNTIEAGWTVDPSLVSATGEVEPGLPHLFVFYWINGQPGCYDKLCPGFQADGSDLAGSVLPTGSKPVLSIEHVAGEWEVLDDDQVVGDYPDRLWNGGFTQFHAAQWFGEVAAAPGTTWPCTQMGDGQFPSSANADTITALTLRNGRQKLAPSVYAGPEDYTPDYYYAEKTSPTAVRFGGSGVCPPPESS